MRCVSSVAERGEVPTGKRDGSAVMRAAESNPAIQVVAVNGAIALGCILCVD